MNLHKNDCAVRTEVINHVLLIEINNPPVNAGSLAVRSGLLDAVEQLTSDPALSAAVIIGGGSTFVAGSDLREFDRPLQEPQLPRVIAAIEACSKPVVAAIHGAALGGGLELALGCDARIALEGVVLAGRKCRIRDESVPAEEATTLEQAAQAAARTGKNRPAVLAAIEAVRDAARQPFDEALARERWVFQQLRVSTEAYALRHQFSAERDAVRLPANVTAQAREVRSVAIIGAGTMGTGIAIAALDAGLSVILLEQDEAALERGRQRVVDHYQSRVTTGKLKPGVAASNESRLHPCTDWSCLAQADLVIEAVFEDLAVKLEVFRKIDAHARPGAVLATNTSYLDVDAIANATSRPQDVLGLHFFSPANVMKLLEVVRGTKTAPDVLATGMAIGKLLKKTPVLCGNAFGFIGNRIYNAYRKQCEFMLEDGAWPEEVDQALEVFGFAMGPFAVADLSGLDIAWRMRRAGAATRDPRERYVAILDALCEQGRLGRKAGAGYYSYTDGKKSAVSDATVRQLIEAASQQRGIRRETQTAHSIQRRALLAMVNEAALLLADSVAQRASDIDVVLVQGYGFPRWQGGPVFWARQQDRAALERELQQLAVGYGYGYTLANLSELLSS